MNANVYQHFRKDEHPFIDTVGDWLEQVEMQYAPYLTDFLDPRQAYILETLIRQNSDLSFTFYVCYEQAERKRCLIYPAYYIPEETDFGVVLFEIIYPSKFATLSHGKILGTLMNVGVRREAFGDIISDGDKWQVFIAQEVAGFVVNQVDKIGKITVRLEERDYTQILIPKDGWQEERTTMSSLRLDSVISAVFN
ncbi:YlmH/Sll1252 family protein, partial [Enterococcus faecalis]